MKKLLVLFVAVAATISSFAATLTYYFNRAQFQWASPANFDELRSIVPEGTNVYSPVKKEPVAGLYDGAEDFNVQVTVPLVYQGTIALSGAWIYEPQNMSLKYSDRKTADCLVNIKENYPAVMTICQPCLDCYPCETLNVSDSIASGEPFPGIFDGLADGWNGVKDKWTVLGKPGYITFWNLYVITKVDKKNKVVYFYKIDLIDETNKTSFFTGATKGDAYVKAQKVDDYNGQFNLQLTGAKNDYKFSYYTKFLTAEGTWEALQENLGQKRTAYIKSAKSLNGTIYYNLLKGGASGNDGDQAGAWDKHLDVLDIAGTVKLTRNASLTGKAIKATFGVEIKKNNAKNWDDCQESDPDSSTCEQYFFSKSGEDYFSPFETEYFGAKYKKYLPVNQALLYNEFIDDTDEEKLPYVYYTAAKAEKITMSEKGNAAPIANLFIQLFKNPAEEEAFEDFYSDTPDEYGQQEEEEEEP